MLGQAQECAWQRAVMGKFSLFLDIKTMKQLLVDNYRNAIIAKLARSVRLH